MRREAFDVMQGIEESWWYLGRARVVSNVLNKFFKVGKKTILDYGSGFGGMGKYLKNFGDVYAMELDEIAMEYCKKRGYVETYSNHEEAFNKRNYDLIGLFDVLEHIEDDKKILYEIYNNLSSGGSLIITVPAYKFLWSSHDIKHHHYRRYKKSEIINLLKNTGFEVGYCGYWNFLLFMPVALLRLVGFGGGDSLEKKSIFENLFKYIVFIEASLIPKISYPFGTSVVVYATKK